MIFEKKQSKTVSDIFRSQNKKPPQKRLNKKAVAAGIVLIIFFFILSVFKTYSNGFGIIVQSTDLYQYKEEVIPTSVDFSVSFSDLNSNAGKVIHTEGACEIKFTSVKKDGNAYTLAFEAKPNYDFFLNHAELISCAKEEYKASQNGVEHSAVLMAKLEVPSGNEQVKITPLDVNDIGTYFTFKIEPKKGTQNLDLRFVNLHRQNWSIKK